jgi:hypothetical protein
VNGDVFHLAQLNIARLLAPIDSPQLADFVGALDRVNALGDGSPGFVWRMQDDGGNATAIAVFDDDDRFIANLTVWESVQALADFAYGAEHVEVMRRRREWFSRMAEAYLVLWWIPAGTVPSLAEAVERLVHLREHGPSPYAFTIRQSWPARGAEGDAVTDDRWACPTG